VNLPNGFHLAVAQFLAKFDAVALLQSFRHFPCNEKPTRARHTTSLNCCLPATDAIDRREKIHACALRFKVGSCKRARLYSIRCTHKKIRSDTFLTDHVYTKGLLREPLSKTTKQLWLNRMRLTTDQTTTALDNIT
jgi:hypothetical protein